MTRQEKANLGTPEDRLPPHDVRNEMAVLGCILHDNACFQTVVGSVKDSASLFYDLRCREAFEAMQRLHASTSPISTVSLYTEIGPTANLPFIAELMDASPSAAHLEYSLDRVRSAFVARKVIAACAGAIAEAFSSGGGEDVMTALSARIAETQQLLETKAAKPVGVVLRRCIDRYERMTLGPAQGLPTGFLSVDTIGGLTPGELILICGQTGLGKSTLALNILHSCVRIGIPAAVFSLEMSDEAWLDRLISLDLGIDRRAFRSKEHFTQGVLDRVAANVPRLGKLPLWLVDDPGIGSQEIARIAEALVSANGVRLVVIDYAQLVEPDASKDNREQQVAAIGRAARQMAQRLKVVCLMLSQLNDEGKVRESRALLHEAHMAITLTERDNGLWIVCSKGRDVQFNDFPVSFDALRCRLTQQSPVQHHNYESP